jgi:hypothetical protein
MPLPPALAKKLATRGILSENEGKILIFITCLVNNILKHIYYAFIINIYTKYLLKVTK